MGMKRERERDRQREIDRDTPSSESSPQAVRDFSIRAVYTNRDGNPCNTVYMHMYAHVLTVSEVSKRARGTDTPDKIDLFHPCTLETDLGRQPLDRLAL